MSRLSYNIVFSKKECSESGEKYAQNKHCLQAKTIQKPF